MEKRIAEILTQNPEIILEETIHGEHILLADWNSFPELEKEIIRNYPEYSCEYQDEYVMCCHCIKYVCTTPQHAWWRPEGIEDPNGFMCKFCWEQFPEDFVRYFYSEGDLLPDWAENVICKAEGWELKEKVYMAYPFDSMAVMREGEWDELCGDLPVLLVHKGGLCLVYVRRPNMILLVSDSCGIYVPQVFAENFGDNWGISGEDLAILKEGPDHEWYWETWETVLNNAKSTCKEEDREYGLQQDGNLWAIEILSDYPSK
jgi:hypothetical protein